MLVPSTCKSYIENIVKMLPTLYLLLKLRLENVHTNTNDINWQQGVEWFSFYHSVPCLVVLSWSLYQSTVDCWSQYIVGLYFPEQGRST
jgi:hypothetical protein